MNAPDSFEAMRADLVARGLLTSDFALTEAGNAHALQLIQEFDAAEVDADFAGPRVRWNHNPKVAA